MRRFQIWFDFSRWSWIFFVIVATNIEVSVLLFSFLNALIMQKHNYYHHTSSTFFCLCTRAPTSQHVKKPLKSVFIDERSSHAELCLPMEELASGGAMATQ